MSDESRIPADGLLDQHDQDVLAWVARLVDELDPVPADLVERATFAVALDELEAEVASLVQQAETGTPELAGVRGAPTETARTMTFTAESATITITVVAQRHGRWRIDGWLSAAEPMQVRLRLPGETRQGQVEPTGRFAFTDVPSGMVQLAVGPAGGDHALVVTPAVQL